MTEAKPLSPSSHSFSITFRRLAGQISPEPRRREIERMVADAEAHRSEDAAFARGSNPRMRPS